MYLNRPYQLIIDIPKSWNEFSCSVLYAGCRLQLRNTTCTFDRKEVHRNNGNGTQPKGPILVHADGGGGKGCDYLLRLPLLLFPRSHLALLPIARIYTQFSFFAYQFDFSLPPTHPSLYFHVATRKYSLSLRRAKIADRKPARPPEQPLSDSSPYRANTRFHPTFHSRCTSRVRPYLVSTLGTETSFVT